MQINSASNVLTVENKETDDLKTLNASELEQALKQLRESENLREQLVRRLLNTQEEERRRISRELHDNLGQNLTAISLLTKVIEQQLQDFADQSLVSENLHKIQSITDELMKSSHHLAWELRPTALDNLGLGAALEQYLSNWRKDNAIEANFANEIDEGNKKKPPITCEAETALFRVAQEALVNVIRHSGATHVTIFLGQTDDLVTLTVEDNGRGYKFKDHSFSLGLGIVGMQERLDLVGGRLNLKVNDVGGLSVQAQVPVRADSH